MRRCEDCRIILETDARFCPKCGRKVGDVDKIDNASRQVVTLLASANLHRSRHEWDAAIADATRALELEPNNAQAAYLLGLLHEQCGRLEEASTWYRLASDLDPNDAVIKSKLDEIAKPTTALAWRLLGKRQLVVLGAVAILLVLVTALTTAWVVKSAQSKTQRSTVAKSSGRKTQIKTPVTKPITQTQTAATGAIGPGTSSSAQPVTQQPNRTAGESGLKSRLAETLTLQGSGAVIDDVVADPRSGTVIVTFSLLYSPASGVTKARILECAWQISRAACESNAEVRNVITRCIITPGGPETTQIAFVGEVKRNALQGIGERPTLTQLENAFENEWWNPQII